MKRVKRPIAELCVFALDAVYEGQLLVRMWRICGEYVA